MSLGPTSRALVAAAREGRRDPDAATAARVRAKIAASVAGGVAATIATTTTSSSAAMSGGSSGAMSGGSMSGGAMSGVSSATMSGAMSGGSVSGGASGGAMSGGAMSGGAMSGGAMSGGAMSGGAMSGGAMSTNAMSGGSSGGAMFGGSSGGAMSGGSVSGVSGGTSVSSTGAVFALGASSPVAHSLVLKLGLLALAIGVVASTVIIEHARTTQVTAPAIAAPATPDDEPRGTVHLASPESRPLPSPDSRPDLGRPTNAPPRPSPGRPESVPATVSGPTLAREVELIDGAMSELRVAHYTTALQTIDVYERETAGRGQLGEDAAAIAIEAHCRLHDSVTAMLDVFDRTWPSSAQRTRLTAACRP